MVQQGQIDHLLQETSEIQPPAHVYEQATLKDYQEVYQRSITDPEQFWAEIASELDWFKPWDKIFQWDYPNFQWFLGGQCNICLLYTSPSPRDLSTSRMPSSA